jgi:colanic acid/amylovoran biosynthesis protein
MQQGGHAFWNLGDWAMLLVAVRRCRELFPGCEIQVVVVDPERLRVCVPGTAALTMRSCSAVLGTGSLFGRYAWKSLPWEQAFVQGAPRVSLPLIRLRRRYFGLGAEDVDRFVQAVRHADLVIASGGGFVTDVFPGAVDSICGVLAIAQRLGKPTAMFSQGLGPIGAPAVVRQASRALRRLDLLTLREGRYSPTVARQLGVRPERMLVTGDDAIPLAYELRQPKAGIALGLNVRTSGYAQMTGADIASLADVVRRLLVRFGVEPRLLPISFHDDGEDWKSTAALLPKGCDATGGSVERPEDVVRLAGECRLVITGSYHAGVFALAQGIPVVGLAKSKYYEQKFQGLAEQFGDGCAWVLLGGDGALRRLEEVAVRLWENADVLRPLLLGRAEDQMLCGRRAYGKLKGLVREGPGQGWPGR